MKLVVADSGQIEARVVAWLAGERAVLDTFLRNDAKSERYAAAFAEKAGARTLTKEEARAIDDDLAAVGIEDGDFYSDRGSTYFGRKLSKKETPNERQFSKSMELGLGFGMGWKKFGAEVLKGMMGAKPVQFTAPDAEKFAVNVTDFEQRPWGGGTCGGAVRDAIEYGVRLSYIDALIHFAVSDHFVRLYRDTNTRISALWRTMENALGVMAPPEGDPDEIRFDAGDVKLMRHALLKPNGLRLHYPGLQRGDSGYTYIGGKSGRERTKIYGGLLTENVVQSLARDIIFEQALWIRAEGYRIGTRTHDEIVCVVPDDQAERCYSYMISRMRTPPTWCADLPLNASGGIGQSYGEVK